MFTHTGAKLQSVSMSRLVAPAWILKQLGGHSVVISKGEEFLNAYNYDYKKRT